MRPPREGMRWAAMAALALPWLTPAWAAGQASPAPPEAPTPTVTGVQLTGPLLSPRIFENSRDPPTVMPLTGALAAREALGHAVFNTQFVAAGTAGAERIDGLGPFFNSSACDECHNEGADARGPERDGPAPGPLVVQLEPPARDGQPLTGDPHYGHVLSTAALEGLLPEGEVWIHYQIRRGHYPDGSSWELRVPSYQLSGLRYGALAPDTVIRPRMAPPLFGDGLLEAVPAAAIVQGVQGPPGTATLGMPAWQWVNGQRVLGRFGWQGSAVSIRDQTNKAFSREMGLTTREAPYDDCTAIETDCRAQPSGGQPEVSDELFDGVVEFVRWLAVPAVDSASPTRTAGTAGTAGTVGTADAPRVDPTFLSLGCAACHRPELPVIFPDAQAKPVQARIAPYTDLRLHDLGAGLADRDVSGRVMPSRWRTPPLWGLGYRLERERFPTLLHDGRARSLEEAILWHDGEARAAREGFEQLSGAQRAALLRWLATL